MQLVEGVGALAGEGADVTGATVGEGELETGGHELLDVRALDVFALLDLGNLEDVDRGETGTVTSSHVLVQRLGGLGTRKSTELLVHVVGARSRVVSQPDGEVLDLEGLLLVDLWARQNRGECQYLCFLWRYAQVQARLHRVVGCAGRWLLSIQAKASFGFAVAWAAIQCNHRSSSSGATLRCRQGNLTMAILP